MVGGVLEANKRWDIGNEVISCISKDFPGVLPIRPKVGTTPLVPLLVAALRYPYMLVFLTIHGNVSLCHDLCYIVFSHAKHVLVFRFL